MVDVPPHENRVEANVIYRGGRQRLDVLVWRLAGHNSPITLTARKLPPGVTAAPFVVGGRSKWGTLVLEAAADAPLGEAEIEVVGSCDNESGHVERIARVGGLTWDTGNSSGDERMQRGLMLAVRDTAPFIVSANPAEVTLRQGEPLKFTVQVRRQGDAALDVQITAAGMPNVNDMEIPIKTLAGTQTEQSYEISTAKLPPGKFSFIVNGEAQVPFQRAADKPKMNLRRWFPSNAITVDVQPKEPAK